MTGMFSAATNSNQASTERSWRRTTAVLRKIPTKNFLRYYGQVPVPEWNGRGYKIVGFSGWHNSLSEADRNLSVEDMLALAEPLLRERIKMFLPNAEFLLKANRTRVSANRVARGAPPGCRHWTIFIKGFHHFELFIKHEDEIWHIPYKEYYH
jgi:hypothetical protein